MTKLTDNEIRHLIQILEWGCQQGRLHNNGRWTYPKDISKKLKKMLKARTDK